MVSAHALVVSGTCGEYAKRGVYLLLDLGEASFSLARPTVVWRSRKEI
jgi:hypothetical protein